MNSPAVRLGKLEKTENYDLYNVDDITVYVRKDTESKKNELRIYMKKFLWTKEIVVDGMDILG